MYYLKNALNNIKQNQSKNFIVIFLIILISFVSIVSITINNAAADEITRESQKYGSQIKISQDPEYYQNMIQHGQKPNVENKLSYEQYQRFASSKYVKSADYVQVTQIYSRTLKNATDQTKPSVTERSLTRLNPKVATFLVTGSKDVKVNNDFKNQSKVLVQGRFPKKENEIMISENLRKENNLSLNQELEFIKTDQRTPVTLKIVGTFNAKNKFNEVNNSGDNLIYTTFKTTGVLDPTYSKLSVTYFLKDYRDAEAFSHEIEQIGIPDSMYIDKNEGKLGQIVGPLKNMQTFLMALMIIVSVLGGATLAFVNYLILTNRKQKIAILRISGQSKKQIIISMFLEIIIVVLVAMVIGIIIGVFLVQPVANVLLISMNRNHDILSTLTLFNQKHLDIGLNVTVGFISILKVLFINVILILISVCISINYILSYQPKDFIWKDYNEDIND